MIALILKQVPEKFIELKKEYMRLVALYYLVIENILAYSPSQGYTVNLKTGERYVREHPKQDEIDNCLNKIKEIQASFPSLFLTPPETL